MMFVTIRVGRDLQDAGGTRAGRETGLRQFVETDGFDTHDRGLGAFDIM